MAQAGNSSPASRATAAESLSVVATAAWRLPARWPGLVAIPVSYAVAAAALYDHSYAWIISALVAGGIGAAWYGSPLRKLEARRRERLRAAEA